MLWLVIKYLTAVLFDTAHAISNFYSALWISANLLFIDAGKFTYAILNLVKANLHSNLHVQKRIEVLQKKFVKNLNEM